MNQNRLNDTAAASKQRPVGSFGDYHSFDDFNLDNLDYSTRSSDKKKMVLVGGVSGFKDVVEQTAIDCAAHFGYQEDEFDYFPFGCANSRRQDELHEACQEADLIFTHSAGLVPVVRHLNELEQINRDQVVVAVAPPVERTKRDLVGRSISGLFMQIRSCLFIKTHPKNSKGANRSSNSGLPLRRLRILQTILVAASFKK